MWVAVLSSAVAFWSSRSCAASGVTQSVQQVRDQVVRILDADGEAYQSGIDADFSKIVIGQLEEAHDRWLLNQALHAAEGRGDLGNASGVNHAGCRRAP